MHYKSMFPSVPPPPQVNAHHLFFNRPDQAEWPDYTYLIDAQTGRRRTHRQFIERLRFGITALGAPTSQGGLGLGAEDGEMIGIISQNSMDYITLVHTFLAITVPFALISAHSTPFELKHSLALSKATRLFVNAQLLSLVLPIAKELGIPSSKIYVLGGKAKGRKSFSEMIKHAQTHKVPAVGPRNASKDTLAYLVFSSGTSGLPKAVMISHGNIIFSLLQAIGLLTATAEVFTPPPRNTPEDIPIALAFLPFYHSYGLHFYAFRAFLAPVTFVLMPRWNIERALELIPKYRVTALYLVPSLVHQLVNHPGIEKADLTSLQSTGSGAAYLPADLAAKLQALTPKEATYTEGYGLSEATIGAMGQPYPGILNGRGKLVPGSTGILIPGMEARIVRDDGTDVEVGEVGELFLKGDNIALGYWNNEEATRKTFVDGWLHTGDQFRADEDGYFFFADRAKDTLKVSGMQVSPMEIEDALRAEPQKLIVDVTVAGVSGGRTADEKVPRAWIVLSAAGKSLGASKTIEVLEAWHQNNLSKFKWLRGGIEVVKEIPKLPTGKVLRRVLQDKYEKEVARGARAKL